MTWQSVFPASMQGQVTPLDDIELSVATHADDSVQAAFFVCGNGEAEFLVSYIASQPTAVSRQSWVKDFR